MRRPLALLALAGALGFASAAVAHQAMSLEGTLVAFQPGWVEVKARDGKAYVIDTNARLTRVMVDRKPVDAKELKAGQKVVIDGYGDTFETMLAQRIHIVAAAPAGRR